jgi:hypothetical protein
MTPESLDLTHQLVRGLGQLDIEVTEISAIAADEGVSLTFATTSIAARFIRRIEEADLPRNDCFDATDVSFVCDPSFAESPQGQRVTADFQVIAYLRWHLLPYAVAAVAVQVTR